MKVRISAIWGRLLPLFALTTITLSWLAWIGRDFFRNFFSAIPYGYFPGGGLREFFGGDGMQIHYCVWKLREALLGGPYSIFQDGYNFAASGQIFTDVSISLQFWLILLSEPFGRVGGYNFGFIVLPFILSSWAMYWMLGAVYQPRLGRILGALLFTVLPYRITEAATGHAAGSVLFVLPLFFGALIRHQRLQSKQSLRWTIVAGALLPILSQSEEHTAYYLLVFTPVILSIWFFQNNSLRELPRFVANWRYLVFGAGLTMVLGLIIRALVFDAGLADGAERIARPRLEVRIYSRDINDLFDPGNPVQLGFFIAIGCLILSLVCFGIAIRRGRLRNLWASVRSHALFPFAVVTPLALGLLLGIGTHWSQQSGIYDFAYNYLPFFKYQRVPTKMHTLFFCFLLISYFSLMNALRRKSVNCNLSRYGEWLGLVLLVAQLFQFGVFHSRNSLGMSAMDGFPTALGNALSTFTLPEDRILLFPHQERMDLHATFNQFLAENTRRRFVGGYHGTAPGWFVRATPDLEALNQDNRKLDSLSPLIQAIAPTHLLLKENLLPKRELMSELVNWKLVWRDEGYSLYRLGSR